MAKLAIKKASTDVSVYVFIQTTAAADGSGLTGLVYNSSGLTCYYVRPLAAAAQLALATLAAATTAHSDGGFKEIDATNMPGVYRLDLSDATVATGVNSVVVMLKGATNMAPVVLEIELVAYDPQDAAALGLSSVTAIKAKTDLLPAVAAGAENGLMIGGANAGPVGFSENGNPFADVRELRSTEINTTFAQNILAMYDGTGYAGGTAKLGVDVVKISGDSTAADNLEAFYEGAPITGTVTNAAPTTTTFRDSTKSATDDFYCKGSGGAFVLFTSGALAGLAAKISDYTGSTREFTVAELPDAPAQNDKYVIVGRAED